ncbi:MAG: hypothetical protein ACREGG_01445 [Candidatus Saccharimonadales bacterium]
MGISQSELVQQFDDENPEAGSFEEGVVDFEKVKKLTDLLGTKLKDLSREEAAY